VFVASPFQRFSERLANAAARHPRWFLLGFCVLYLAGACWLSAEKLLWYDEIFTYHTTLQPSLAALWDSLAGGTDLNPPVYYLLARLSTAVFGTHEVALRLPAILGFGIMCLCAFVFVSRRTTPLFGLVALLLPMGTIAYSFYACEARPYGLVLGLCGVALILWQDAADGRRRLWSAIALALCLTTAVATHYYAVLLLLPLGLGELVRWRNLGRLDWLIASALAVPLVPLAFLVPLIRSAQSHAAGFEGKPGWDMLWKFYTEAFEHDLLPWVAVLALVALLARREARQSQPSESATQTGARPHEVVALVALTALPLAGVILGKAVTGALYPRYVLAAIPGCTMLAALLAARFSSNCPRVGSAFLLVFVGWIGVKHFYVVRDYRATPARHDAICAEVRKAAETDLPVVVSHPKTYLQLRHYAPPSVAARLKYLSSPRRSLRHEGHDTMERALTALRPVAGLDVEEYDAFLATGRPFLVYGTSSWVLAALIADGADVRALAPNFFRVQPVAATGSADRAPCRRPLGAIE